jgi:hypothetical protein
VIEERCEACEKQKISFFLFWCWNPAKTGHRRTLGLFERIILECILEKWGLKLWARFSWLRTRIANWICELWDAGFHNKNGKTYSFEYCDVPEVFFTLYHLNCCCINAIQGYYVTLSSNRDLWSFLKQFYNQNSATDGCPCREELARGAKALFQQTLVVRSRWQ